jgi:hypothetical protein
MVQMPLMVFVYEQQKPIHKSGITAYAKFGQTSQKLRDQTIMLIMELEWHAFSPKLAAKANFTYLRGRWYATNYDDKTNVGRDESY